MDRIEQRLIEDATEISAVVPDALTLRIRQAVKRESLSGRPGQSGYRLQQPLAVGFAMGLVAIVAGVLWFAQERPPPVAVETAAVPTALAAYEGTVTRLTTAIDLPLAGEQQLEQELVLLNADLRKIQAGVRRQLDPLL